MPRDPKKLRRREARHRKQRRGALPDDREQSVLGGLQRVDAERAEMSHEIDLEKARQELERAKGAGENDDAAQEAVRRAEARIRAVERAS